MRTLGRPEDILSACFDALPTPIRLLPLKTLINPTLRWIGKRRAVAEGSRVVFGSVLCTGGGNDGKISLCSGSNWDRNHDWVFAADGNRVSTKQHAVIVYQGDEALSGCS